MEPLVQANIFSTASRMKENWYIINDKLNVTSTVTHYENTPIQTYRKFYHQKPQNFQIKKNLIFFIYLRKAEIVGTRYSCLGEAVLTNNYNLCFRVKLRNKCIPL